MPQTARQRLMQMSPQTQSRPASQASEDPSQELRRLLASAAARRSGTTGQGSRGMQNMMQSVRRAQQPMQSYATGGMVGSTPRIPTLMELAQPAPFDATNPIVPMSSTIGPAFGGMGQDVYDWTPPYVAGGQSQQDPRQAPAQTVSTSAYTPVDSTPFGGINIPGAAQISANMTAAQQRRRQEQDALAQMGQMEAGFESQLGALGTELDQTRRRLLTTEEQARMAQEQQAQAAQAEAAQAEAAQMQEMMRRQAEFEEQLAEQRAAAEAAQQQMTGMQGSFDERLQQGIAAELARRDEIARAEAEAARQAQAQAEAEAARQAQAQAEAEAARQAQAQAAARRQDPFAGLLVGTVFEDLMRDTAPSTAARQSGPIFEGA